MPIIAAIPTNDAKDDIVGYTADSIVEHLQTQTVMKELG